MWDTVVLGAAPPTSGLRTEAEFKPPQGIRHSRSSGSEGVVNPPNHALGSLHFSKNAESVHQISIKNIWDSLGKLTRQSDTVVKQNKLPNLDRLITERIKHKYRPSRNKPQPERRNPSPVGKRLTKWIFKKVIQ
ncbi:uncharacterized protein [Haliotis asinina]|uniref:uncharacterized protein isoform X2 n=1 Tax=Haliotis asinina TaxID=109174 RepID=UPI003531EBB6